jgi:tetratricopeptide (TPR) repeat protein
MTYEAAQIDVEKTSVCRRPLGAALACQVARRPAGKQVPEGVPSMPNPLCFIAMPFGRKEAGGRSVEFDAVWDELIAPAIEAADMQPLRADEEQVGGIIHKPMFERLLLCEFAVSDLTLANANVFYEIGVRHAARPATTVLIVADEVRLPFDVAMLRTMPYRVGADGRPSHAAEDAAKLGQLLQECRAKRSKDSPLFQLLDGIKPLEVPSDRTDVFRDQVAYAQTKKTELTQARKSGKDAVDAVRQSLGRIDAVESGVAIDLLLSYRAVKAWQAMADLVGELPEPLRSTVMVQEQLGFALNRAGRGEEAERVLLELIAARGPSSETLGLLGRVYKDRWEAAVKAGETIKARALLTKAIDAYRRGFETDWRDHYPGINAVTLMELKDPPDPERAKLIPVIRYSVERRIAGSKADYWDWATLLELAVLAKDETAAEEALGQALTIVRDSWEPETTARNLRLIHEAREQRGQTVTWAKSVEDALLAAG